LFAYVAACWNPASAAQNEVVVALDRRMRDASRDWRLVLQRPGIAVYCSGSRSGSSEPYLLEDHCGVLLGTVFEKVGDDALVPRKAVLDHRHTRRALQTRGRSLAEDFWGRYVAFIIDRGRILVMRSPTGELDCLTTDILGIHVYFSDARHCPLLSLRNFSVNWDYIAADLSTMLPDTRETGLLEIQRVLRGECVSIQNDRIERFIHWHPFRFVEADPVDSTVVAESELRSIAYACVGAWASCYQSVGQMLSGGVDSSIVAGLLRESAPHSRVLCLNNRNPYDAVSDERRYARLVAARAGYELIEHEQSADVSLEILLNAPKAVSPHLNAYGLGDVSAYADIARTHGIQAWFLGHGGDEIFFDAAGYYSCADFLYRRWYSLHVLRVALEAARMTQRALWPTLIEGVRNGLRRSSLETVLADYEPLLSFPLLRSEVMRSVRQKHLFIPSWFDEGDRIPPGKCFQIIGLAGTDAIHNLLAPEDDPEFVSPLKSQPLQELCLRIPTHVLACGGRRRGLARRAFSSCLPIEIARRGTKGAVQDYLKAIWVRNRSFVKGLLLDGVLVRERIVERSELEKTLAGSFQGDFGSIARVTGLACAEAWLVSWVPDSQRVAA
jgi:asparagine synthase (glutamine-hydrolysing)